MATGVGQDSELIRGAVAVLDANWLGAATRPSPHLYPHQWSWDAAFIATGRVHQDPARAQQELRTLFSGQWSNGLVPHILFTEGVEHYFPGPGFWESRRCPYAPRRPQTSAIVQPPVHASAAWHVYQHSQDGPGARTFLEDLLPRLAAWHAYLYRERADPGSGLIEIWHPWESGMDNSPLWDAALDALAPVADDIPDYRRIDLEFADPAQRPTDLEYDRYVYLVKFSRDRSYLPDRIRADTPFAIHDVLFNSVLVQANHDLARIARELGADATPFEAWAEHTAAGIEHVLWSEEDGMYLDVDARTGEPIRVRAGAGLAPLYAGVPDTARARRLADTLEAFARRLDDGGTVVPSLSHDDPRFDPARYWRGPVWPVLHWILAAGLRRYGFDGEADRLRSTLIALARHAGFREHYDPTTGRGGGGEEFAWTAALVLDLLYAEDDHRPPRQPRGDGNDGRERP